MNTKILKHLRTYHEYSQSLLAFKMNTDVQTIINIESNVVDGLNMEEYLNKYAEIFKVDVENIKTFCYTTNGFMKYMVDIAIWILNKFK